MRSPLKPKGEVMKRREGGGRVSVEVVEFGKQRVVTEATPGQLVKDLFAEVGMGPKPGQEVIVNARLAGPDTRITKPSTVAIANLVTGG